MALKSAVCRKCRREGSKLFLKGERCFTPKCSVMKRTYAPGTSPTARAPKLSDFGKQLREKQKAKAIYGIREKQFKNYYLKAMKTKGSTGETMMQYLELRLDSVIFKLGFARSMREARQIVGHKKIKVNGKPVNIPSYQLREKDIIEPVKKEFINLTKTEVPVWLKLDKTKLSGEIVKLPTKDDMKADVDEAVIVEFYSR